MHREIEVRPTPGHGITEASARHLTPYGEAAVSWKRADGRFALSVQVPVGARASVHLPGGGEPVQVSHGRHDFEAPDPYAAAPVLSPGGTVRDLLDHEGTWSAFVAAAVQTGVVRDEQELAAHLLRHLDAPADQLAERVAPGGFVPGADAFRDHVRGILLEASRRDPAEGWVEGLTAKMMLVEGPDTV
jgi:alpha-L-rhamnosidase